jgi:integrase
MIDRSHPFAFVSFHPRYIGQPYTINAFKDNYHRALRRIGLTPSKGDGLTPHGHRHAYGRRLQTTDVDPIVIRKALHHSSISSQVVYTTPSIRDVTNALSSSSRRLEELSNKGEIVNPIDNWDELLKFGFEDIDPFGLFTGSNPQLIKTRK